MKTQDHNMLNAIQLNDKDAFESALQAGADINLLIVGNKSILESYVSLFNFHKIQKCENFLYYSICAIIKNAKDNNIFAGDLAEFAKSVIENDDIPDLYGTGYFFSKFSILKALFDSGLDRQHIFPCNNNILMLALKHGAASCAEELIINSGHLNLINNDKESFEIIFAKFNGNLFAEPYFTYEKAREMINFSTINHQNSKGMTAPMHMVRENFRFFDTLFSTDDNIDYTITDNDGKNIIMHALENNDETDMNYEVENIEFLISCLHDLGVGAADLLSK